MGLFDAAEELAKDYSRELSGKRWQSYLSRPNSEI